MRYGLYILRLNKHNEKKIAPSALRTGGERARNKPCRLTRRLLRTAAFFVGVYMIKNRQLRTLGAVLILEVADDETRKVYISCIDGGRIGGYVPAVVCRLVQPGERPLRGDEVRMRGGGGEPCLSPMPPCPPPGLARR